MLRIKKKNIDKVSVFVSCEKNLLHKRTSAIFKKKIGGKYRTKMAHQTRNAFSKQPAHYLFLDIAPPTKRSTLSFVCDALSNVVALASSIRGSTRIPVLGMSALCGNPLCLLPLQTLKGKYPLVIAATDRLLNLYDDTSGQYGQSASETTLREELQRALDQFKSYKTGFKAESGDASTWLELQITIINEQSDNLTLMKQLNGALQDNDLENVKKIQVVKVEQMLLEPSVLLDLGTGKSPNATAQSQSGSDQAGTQQSNVCSGLVEIVAISQNSYAIENFFKVWLHDCTTDKAHLELSLPAARDGNNQQPISILCDVREPFLNPGSFIFSNHYFINADPLVSHGLLTNQVRHGSKGAELQVPTLESVQLVKLAGMCESTVYGVPLVLQPTSCWKMEWNDLESNSHRFLSLCRMLEESGSVLIVRSRSPDRATTSGRGDSLQSYFGIFAANVSLLIKSLAFRDVLLPSIDGQIPTDHLVPQEVRLDVESRLRSLATVEVFNPVHFDSSLCANLKRCLLNAQATRSNQASIVSTSTIGSRQSRLSLQSTKQRQSGKEF